MVFRIENTLANKEFIRFRLFNAAKLSILTHRITLGEQKLNMYIKHTYGVDLVQMSLYLLNQSKIDTDKDNNIIISFRQKSDDNLAAMITYGNQRIKGSNILKTAFFRA